MHLNKSHNTYRFLAAQRRHIADGHHGLAEVYAFRDPHVGSCVKRTVFQSAGGMFQPRIRPQQKSVM